MSEKQSQDQVEAEASASGVVEGSPRPAPEQDECLPFNAALALLYELSIANAPYPPGDCRDLAEKIVARIDEGVNRVQTILAELEKIDTTKLAAARLYDEANAVSRARVFIDRLIEAE